MTQLGESGLTLDKATKAMNFISGHSQERKQEGFSRWSRGATEYRAQAYCAGEELDEIDVRTRRTGKKNMMTYSEAYYACAEEDETYLAGDETGDTDTEEFDEVYSAYVNATKQHPNIASQLRGDSILSWPCFKVHIIHVNKVDLEKDVERSQEASVETVAEA